MTNINKIAYRILYADNSQQYNGGYKYIYHTIKGCVQKLVYSYTSTIPTNSVGNDYREQWQSKKGTANDPLSIISKRTWQKKFCDANGNGQLNDLIPDSDEGLNDLQKLNNFLKDKWFPIIKFISSTPYKNLFFDLQSQIGTATPFNPGTAMHYTPKDVSKWILNINNISSDAFNNYDLTKEECITTFKNINKGKNYYIYFIYNDNNNLIVAAAEDISSGKNKTSNIIYTKLAAIDNVTDNEREQNICNAYKDVEMHIILKIKNLLNISNDNSPIANPS